MGFLNRITNNKTDDKDIKICELKDEIYKLEDEIRQLKAEKYVLQKMFVDTNEGIENLVKKLEEKGL